MSNANKENPSCSRAGTDLTPHAARENGPPREEHAGVMGKELTESREVSPGGLVHELFEDQVRRRPEAPAVVSADASLTYGDLNRRSNQLAHKLRFLGVAPEVAVAVCMPRCPGMVVAYMGIVKAGGVFVPLDPSYPEARLQSMMKGISFLVTGSGPDPQPTLDPELRSPNAPACQVVSIACDGSGLPEEREDDPASWGSPGNLVYTIFTSGSTGEPKGVQVEHRSLANLIHWHHEAFGVGPRDRATQIAGLGFDALVWEVWPYLTRGASIHLPDDSTRSSSGELQRWLSTSGITLSFLPTPLAEALLEQDWPEDLSLRFLLTGGDKLHRGPSRSLAFTFVNNYGPTENTVVTTSGPVPPAASSSSPPSIGRPIRNVQVYVVDSDFHEVATGEPGELVIGGDSLARGYWNDPGMSAFRFVPDPFSGRPGARLYRSGDLVRLRPDGELEFLGRLDNQVKIRGFRIELGEVEVILAQHPGVRQVVVTVQDQPAIRRLVAYVVPHRGYSLEPDDLTSFLGERLPEHMVPAVFVELETLPLTPNGKVDRSALPEPPSARPPSRASMSVPRSAMEERLAKLVAEVLNVHEVTRDDCFFELGGDSVLSIQLVAKANEVGIGITPDQVFEHTTIVELARAAESGLEEPGGRRDETSEDDAAETT